MKKIILGTTLALILLSACEKGIFSKKSTELINFEISQNSEAVPATIRLEYSFEVENDCAEYSLGYMGADSTRMTFYDENNPNALDEIKFSESTGSSGDLSSCAQGDVIIIKGIYDLKYLNAGDYEVILTFNGETEKKSFSLSAL